jgi:tripartite-type tricarboxylate transporter receptor subunit TctC
MPSTRRSLLLASAGAIVGVASGRAAAQANAQTTRIFVPFSAGALTDIIARIYADKLTPLLGQPVIVENRPGAGGVTATQALATAPADGHTWLFVSSAHATNPALRLKLPYDTEKDFSGLALIASSPSVVVVNASHPAKSLQEFLAIAKRTPGAMSFGSAGIGAATHLAGEYFMAETGAKLLHVPYKGVQEAVSAVVGGQLDTAFPPIALALSLIKSGRLRALAVTSPERVAVMPDTPTMAEQGFAKYDSSIWYALVLSSAVPKPVMEQLAAKVREVSNQPDVIEKLRSQGLIPKQLVLRDFDKFIADEIRLIDRLVKASGYKPE